jgi:ABC-type branched-subunit amino acid transport system ATPase component
MGSFWWGRLDIANNDVVKNRIPSKGEVVMLERERRVVDCDELGHLEQGNLSAAQVVMSFQNLTVSGNCSVLFSLIVGSVSRTRLS